jgi:hypothetical protein
VRDERSVDRLLPAVPIGRDAEVQGNEDSCETDSDQQAAKTNPTASTAAQRDCQPTYQRNQKTYFRDSPRDGIVEGRRKHRGPHLLLSRPSPQA